MTEDLETSVEELRAVLAVIEFGGTVPLNSGATVTVTFPPAAAEADEAPVAPAGTCEPISAGMPETGCPVLTCEPAPVSVEDAA